MNGLAVISGIGGRKRGFAVSYPRGGCVGVLRLVFSLGGGGVGMMGLAVLYLRGGRVGGGGLAVLYLRGG